LPLTGADWLAKQHLLLEQSRVCVPLALFFAALSFCFLFEKKTANTSTIYKPWANEWAGRLVGLAWGCLRNGQSAETTIELAKTTATTTTTAAISLSGN